MDKQLEQRILKAYNEYQESIGGESIEKIPANYILSIDSQDYNCPNHDFDDSHLLEVKFDLDTMCYLHYIDGKLAEVCDPMDIEILISDLSLTDDPDRMFWEIQDLCDKLYGDNKDEK